MNKYFLKTILISSFLSFSTSQAAIIDFINVTPTERSIADIESNYIDEIKSSTVYDFSSILNSVRFKNSHINQVEKYIGDNSGYVYLDISLDSVEKKINSQITPFSIFKETLVIFKLSDNGTTIVCDGALSGDTGIVNDKSYTAVDNDILNDKIGSNDVVFYESICTSLVTDMNLSNSEAGGVFYDSTINPLISSWDVSNVVDMSYMFNDSINFNADISIWDTVNVSNMDSMLQGTSSFDQNISNWCVINIPDNPTRFSLNSLLDGYIEKFPQWGSCSNIYSIYGDKTLLNIVSESSLNIEGKDLNNDGLRDDVNGFILNLRLILGISEDELYLSKKLALSFQDSLLSISTEILTDNLDAYSSIYKYKYCLESYYPANSEDIIDFVEMSVVNNEVRNNSFSDFEISISQNLGSSSNSVTYPKAECFI